MESQQHDGEVVWWAGIAREYLALFQWLMIQSFVITCRDPVALKGTTVCVAVAMHLNHKLEF